jgi:uncharacterized membrane protein
MKSTAHLNGHPIHPMLIPYPFALLSSSVGFELAGRMAGRQDWLRTASHIADVGLVAALTAAIPGAVDYFGTVPRESEASRQATKHAISNLSAVACFAYAAVRRRVDGGRSDAALAFGLLGTALLAVGGWLGGELVYHQRIGVTEGFPVRRFPPERWLDTGGAHGDVLGDVL